MPTRKSKKARRKREYRKKMKQMVIRKAVKDV